MVVTYKKAYKGLELEVPVLHDVVIRTGEIISRAEYEAIYDWCQHNCKEQFYIYPSWTNKIGCQFEDDEDATMFALRWT